MAKGSNNCAPCKDNVFKRLSSNPDISELLGDVGREYFAEGDGEFIFVTTVEDQDSTTFQIRYEPYVPLQITSFTDDIGLQLIGFTVNTFNLDWTYNKGVETQSLNQGLTAPAVVTDQLTYTLAVTSAGITSDTTITLTADDDTTDANAAKTAQTSILFGNNYYHGAVAIANTATYDPSEAAIKALGNSPIARNKSGIGAVTYSNTGTGVYEVFAAPSDSVTLNAFDFGITNFQDSGNPLPGGFVLVKTLNITNTEGFTQEYTVWRSSYDDSAGSDAFGNAFTYTPI